MPEVNKYIARLRRKLTPIMPAEQLEAYLIETEQHIRASALEPRGEAEAIRRYGSDRQIVEGMRLLHGRKERVALGTALLLMAPSLLWLGGLWDRWVLFRYDVVWLRVIVMFGPVLLGAIGALQFRRLRPARVVLALAAGIVLSGMMVGIVGVSVPEHPGLWVRPRWIRSEVQEAARANIVTLSEWERSGKSKGIGYTITISGRVVEDGSGYTVLDHDTLQRMIEVNRQMAAHLDSPESAILPTMLWQIGQRARDESSYYAIGAALVLHLAAWLARSLVADMRQWRRARRFHA